MGSLRCQWCQCRFVTCFANGCLRNVCEVEDGQGPVEPCTDEVKFGAHALNPGVA
jgi:hypothetical protein